MTLAQLKKSLERVLSPMGYKPTGKILCSTSGDVSILIAVEKGFGSQHFINVGFWLHRLSEEVPDKVELSHAYFRLERLFPDHRELILSAGDLEDPQQVDSWSELTALLATHFVQELKEIATLEGLRNALSTRLKGAGLIRKELKEFLA